jgi:hypothetical protein
MVREDKRETHQAILLGAVIAFAFFVRTQGILLLASYGALELFQLWRNGNSPETVKKTLRGLLLVCGSFGLLWLVYVLVFPSGSESYFDQYKDFQIQTVLGYTTGYFSVVSEFFGKTDAWRYFYYFLVIFFLIGLWVRRGQETIFIVFTLVWMLLLVTWPAWQGPRFIFPLLPIFMYFVFHGMKTLMQKLPAHGQVWGQRIFVIFWLVIIGLFLYRSGADSYENISRDRKALNAYESYSMEMYEFIRENTPPESIIVFFKPRALRMFTDRDSYVAITCEEITRGDYVVVNQLAENSQVPADELDECGIPIQVVFESRRFIAYEILQ